MNLPLPLIVDLRPPKNLIGVRVTSLLPVLGLSTIPHLRY
nr:MAG TPA: hypothetical protein [Crassvirales sp.]